MSLPDKLKKLAKVTVVGATMFAADGVAQEQEAQNPITPQVQSVSMVQPSWDTERFSEHEIEHFQKVYDSLPDKYKEFAGKDFDTRFAMKEEHQQRLWKELSEENPNEQVLSSLAVEMDRDNLNIAQKNMVEDLVYLGRPAETLDTSQTFENQLLSCGFDKVAQVAGGFNPNEFSFEDKGKFVHQMFWSQQVLNENPHEKVKLNQHIQDTKKNETGKSTVLSEDKIPQFSWMNVNGSEIQENPVGLSAAGSYSRQTVLNVAEKLKNPDKESPVVPPKMSNELLQTIIMKGR